MRVITFSAVINSIIRYSLTHFQQLWWFLPRLSKKLYSTLQCALISHSCFSKQKMVLSYRHGKTFARRVVQISGEGIIEKIRPRTQKTEYVTNLNEFNSGIGGGNCGSFVAS